MTHSHWSSRFAFILAATGSAVGLGNIWKFPYITGENGGGAFVLVYLACILLIGIPIMIAEIMLGRRSQRNPIEAMQLLTTEANAHKNWHYFGWLGVIAGALILSYYSVIAGWATSYIFKALFGSFFNADSAQIKTLFDNFTHSPIQLIFWHSVFMILTMGIVSRGIDNGLEKANSFLMPGLFVLLVLLVGYAMTTNSYQKGLDFMFGMDFSKLNSNAVLTAMGHAFFTLSLGMGAIMVYGSYLPKHISITKATFIIAGADTVVALLAGIAIFPLVFEHGLEPSEGPGLIFQALPLAFGNMTGGWLMGIFFFVLLFFAALTSSISLIEPAVAWLVENKDFTREKACIWTGLGTWLLGLGTVFSFNIWQDVLFFGKNIFQLLDYATANVMLPIGGLGIAVFAGHVMAKQHSQEELELPNQQSFDVWYVLVRYVAPAAIFLVFLHVIGVL